MHKKRKSSKTVQTIHKIAPSDIRVEKALVENFVSMQRVLTNLSVKFDNLADKISKLLELFEISAKALAEKDFETGIVGRREDDKKILEKLDNLFDQNKTIARGLSMLHERGSPLTSPNPRSPIIPGSPRYHESISYRESQEPRRRLLPRG